MPGAEDLSTGALVPKMAADADGLSISTQDTVTRIGSPDETTGLLAAGCRNSYDEPSVDVENEEPPLKDSWVGYSEFAGLPWYKRPSVYWLLFPYALFTLAFGGSLVPKLNLIVDLVCQRYFADKTVGDGGLILTPIVFGGDNPQCNIPEVQSNVATFMLILNVVVGVLSAYTAPMIGSLSDRYGRKKLLALTSAGGVCGEIVTIIAAKFPEVIHYRWLLVGVVFDGLAGSFTAGSVLIHSFTSDCTPPSKRGVAIGFLHSCLFSGLAFGPLLAGYFVKWTGTLLSIFYVTVGCHVFFIICVGLVIPESVSKRRQLLAREKYAEDMQLRDQRTREWASAYLAASEGTSSWFWRRFATPKYANFLASLRSANPFEPLKVLRPKGIENTRVRRNLTLLAVADMVIMGAAMSSGQVTLLYSEYIFGWGNFETSEFISVVSLVRVVVLMCIFPIINYFFRTRPAQRRRRESGAISESISGADNLDIWILRVALLSDVLGVTGYIFARSEALFIASGIITAFGGMGSATIQSMLSKHVPAERVGQLLGAIGVMHSLSRIVAPVILNGLYAGTVKTFPQAVFVAITVMFIVVLVLAMLVRPHVYMKEPEDESDETATLIHPEPNAERRDILTDEEILPHQI